MMQTIVVNSISNVWFYVFNNCVFVGTEYSIVATNPRRLELINPLKSSGSTVGHNDSAQGSFFDENRLSIVFEDHSTPSEMESQKWRLPELSSQKNVDVRSIIENTCKIVVSAKEQKFFTRNVVEEQDINYK